MKKRIFILSVSLLLMLGFCLSSVNNVKLYCEEQMPKVLSPAGPGSQSDSTSLFAEEQMPKVLVPAEPGSQNNMTNLFAEEQMPKVLTQIYSA